MNEMEMALKMIAVIENLSPDDFIAEYNRVTGESIGRHEITSWNGFPVYYDPDD